MNPTSSPQRLPQRRSFRGGQFPNKDNSLTARTNVRHTLSREPKRRSDRIFTKIYREEGQENLLPPPEKDVVRIIHLGGVEEIGRNMSLIELNDQIIVIDAGVQFSEDSTPGIDFILPNTKYLENNKEKIKGVIITHGHLDHIGGIPYLLQRIGNPPIYARNFTALMVKKRQEEFPSAPPLDIRLVEKNERIKIGEFHVKFFAVTHAIPDSMGVIVETENGDIVHTGDLRLDHLEGEPSEMEKEVYETFRDRKVLLLMTDSTNAENPGFSISEKVVYQNIEKIIQETTGRLIVSTFASQVERMLKMIELAEKHGRKVVVEGRSMKTNIEVVKLAGLLKCNPETIITIEEMEKYPENKIIAMVTGAQGEEFAALMRIANKIHKYIRLSPRDTILMSSSIIPGNERNVQKLKDNLSRQGAHIIHYKTSDIHSSGHANADELAWIHQKIKPKFFVPVHGYHYMLRVHADIAKKGGLSEENILIPDNGMIIEISADGEKIEKKNFSAPNSPVMVDGFSVGSIQDVVIRDRQMLAQDGIFTVVAILDTKIKKLRKSPDIISRGFVYLKESQDLLREARFLAKKTVEQYAETMNPINFDYIKDELSETMAKFLVQKTAKRPIITSVVIGV